MWYHATAFSLTKRDVIGAWFVCLAIATAFFGYPVVSSELYAWIGDLNTVTTGPNHGADPRTAPSNATDRPHASGWHHIATDSNGAVEPDPARNRPLPPSRVSGVGSDAHRRSPTIQVFSAAPRTTGIAVRRVIRGRALLAIGGLGAISVGAYGADLETGYSRAVAAPSRSAPAVRRSTPARPIDPPGTELNQPLQRAALVDRLYGELIRSSGCVLASSKASIGGGC